MTPNGESEKPKEFIVGGMRVKILPSHGLVDIRGGRGEALFFMATLTPERTLGHLKACVDAIDKLFSKPRSELG